MTQRIYATLMVKSLAISIDSMSELALEENDAHSRVVEAVRAAREAFYASGITSADVDLLREELTADLETRLQELDDRD